MGLFKNIGKTGILISFIAAVAYDITGVGFLKTVSLVTGILSVTILASYLTQFGHWSREKDVLHYFRFLK